MAATRKKSTTKRKPATKKAPAKKSTKTRPVKKAPVQKAPTKPAETKTTSLRKPQLRVLEALDQADRALTRKEISEKGKVDLAMLTDYIGSLDEKIRKKNDVTLMPSLLTLGYVKYAPAKDGDTTHTYVITPAGRNARLS